MLGKHLPAVGQIRVVDLQVQAGVGDGLVLVAHALRPARTGTLRRSCSTGCTASARSCLARRPAETPPRPPPTLSRAAFRLAISALRRGLADIGHRAADDHRSGEPHRRPAARSVAAEASAAGLEELRKLAQVARVDVARRQLAGLAVRWLDAAESVAHVVEKVALAQLAVVDDVDASLDLLLDNLFDSLGQRQVARWSGVTECGRAPSQSLEVKPGRDAARLATRRMRSVTPSHSPPQSSADIGVARAILRETPRAGVSSI